MIDASWKFCGKCGHFLAPKLKDIPAKIRKLYKTPDKIRNSYDVTIRRLKEDRLKHIKDNVELKFALTIMEVNNGARAENGYDELYETERKAERWAEPLEQPRPVDMDHFKDIKFPIRPPVPVLKPLTHISYNVAASEDGAAPTSEDTNSPAALQEGDQPSKCWFWGEPKLSEPRPINALWHPSDPLQNPLPPEPAPEEVPVDESLALKQKEEANKLDMYKKLEAWPNIMGKRFRRCVHSMRGNLRLCDVNVVDFQDAGKIKFLTGLLDALLGDIQTTKNITHIVNQEQILYYNELEQFRAQVSASMLARSQNIESDSDTNLFSKKINWEDILSDGIEDNERDEIDILMKLRCRSLHVIELDFWYLIIFYREWKLLGEQIYNKWSKICDELSNKCIMQYNRVEALIYDTAARRIQEFCRAHVADRRKISSEKNEN